MDRIRGRAGDPAISDVNPLERPTYALAVGAMTVPAASFEERVAAAARAGIGRIGYHLRHYKRDRAAGVSDADLVAIAAGYGVRVVEVESVHRLLDPGDDPRTAGAFSELVRLAEMFGAGRMIAHADFDGNVVAAGRRFAAWCDQAAATGVSVGLEFVPWTSLSDLATTLTLVEAADRPNAGIVMDTWHFFRGDDRVDVVRELPPGALVAVQLTDGPLTSVDPDPTHETLTRRAIPGSGDFDLGSLVAALAERGGQVECSLEVISPDLDQLPPVEAVALVADGARGLFSSSFDER